MKTIYSLSEQDIHTQTSGPASEALYTATDIKAGIMRCRNNSKSEAKKCCDKHSKSGPVIFDPDLLLGNYGCNVDYQTGDWD